MKSRVAVRISMPLLRRVGAVLTDYAERRKNVTSQGLITFLKLGVCFEVQPNPQQQAEIN
jgi:hypothetical protein